jgi:hypothetical protein
MPELPLVGIVNSVITPEVVIRPILLASDSVNQRFPSAPAVIAVAAREIEIGNSVITPVGVIRSMSGKPTRPPVNQRFPSDPLVMAPAPVRAGKGKYVMEGDCGCNGTPSARRNPAALIADSTPTKPISMSRITVALRRSI